MRSEFCEMQSTLKRLRKYFRRDLEIEALPEKPNRFGGKFVTVNLYKINAEFV